jgi:hypothetical protein
MSSSVATNYSLHLDRPNKVARLCCPQPAGGDDERGNVLFKPSVAFKLTLLQNFYACDLPLQLRNI